MPPRSLDAATLAMQSAIASLGDDSGPLCLSSRGLKRSRGGSSKGAVEKGASTPDVVIETRLIKHSPDGKVCLTCPRKDNEQDPVAEILGKTNEDGSVIFMAWIYPPKDGRTVGDYCYYCVRVWLKDGKAFGLNIGDWKKALAKKGEKGIELHHQRVLPQIPLTK